MPPRFLLINPWVYDFAAVDLWARPLGLYRVAENLSRFDTEIVFLDLMDTHQRDRPFGTGKYPRTIVPKPNFLGVIPRHFARYGRPERSLIETLGVGGPLDAVLITGIMAYWYPGIIRVVEIIRRFHRHVPILLGGIYPALWPDHARSLSGIEAVHIGPPDDRFHRMLYQLGIHLEPVRDDPLPWYRIPALAGSTGPAAPLETGTGCPLGCPYCASRKLSGGLVRKEPDDVVSEILTLNAMGVRDLAFYDDALLWDPDNHIKPILREIDGRRLDLRFHTPNGLHARFIDPELATLMMRTGFKTLRLSLETVDDKKQRESGKVLSEEFASAVSCLKEVGFRKEDIGAYLMYGLPGQELEEVEQGVEFIAAQGARVHLTEYSPIPGTDYWDLLVSNGTISEGIDPLMTNNTVFSLLFSGYDPDRLEALKGRARRLNGSKE
jgi:radical SAM superfamily enzyme YgiQ (UPF0313 family)